MRCCVSTYVTHLNIAASSTPLFAIGAFFGNDQFAPDFAFARLSVFGLSGQLLGFVDVPVNDNTSVDQFIGVRSDAAFSRVRIENLAASGSPSQDFSVVLDDLAFVLAVREPSLPVLEPVLLGLLLARMRSR